MSKHSSNQSKKYDIKVHGNSGCEIKIFSLDKKIMVMKSTNSKEYSERLNNQRIKQDNFQLKNKKIIIPKVIQYDKMSFTMEYLHMMDAIQYFERENPIGIKKKVNIILEYILENLKVAQFCEIKSDLFLMKIESIKKVIPPEIWSDYYSLHEDILLEEIPAILKVPIGDCHGDLTFSNIMFSIDDDKIGFIDFLDSFIESPIIDIVKLRQDTKFNWTNLKYKEPHDNLKISIIMSWINSMINSVFNQIINMKKTDKKIRRIMRGYSTLKKNNSLSLLSKVKHILEDCQDINFERDLNSIFKYKYNIPSISVKQYIFQRVIYNTFLNESILYSYGSNNSLSFPIPRLWQKSIADNGIYISFVRSTFLWAILVMKFWLKGVYIYFKKINSYFFFKGNKYQKNNYSHIYGLSESNFFTHIGKNEAFDTISWFVQNRLEENENILVHNVSNVKDYKNKNVNVVFSRNETPEVTNKLLTIKFFLFGFYLIIDSFFRLFVGNWGRAIMLGELLKALEVHYVNKPELPHECFFSNSEWIYRPLWTYIAENKGVKISFYFYSTNISSFKTESGYPKQNFSWNLSSWPNYLVWDDYQKDFVNREIKFKKNIEIVGPIWDSDCIEEIPEKIKNGIAVFDIQPTRESVYQVLGLENEYYRSENVCKFIKDINKVFGSGKHNIVFKQKRYIGNRESKKYSGVVSNLSKNMIIVDSCISAIRVIDACDCVISFPFTSTAILGLNANKTSMYYDPTGEIQKDDRAAHGVPVISGFEELKIWGNKL